MSPERAKVYLFEDDPDWREWARESLESEGHSVVGEATNQEEAKRAASSFNSLTVQVAVVDANLLEDDLSGKDGQNILADIRENAPHVKTVGYSLSPMQGVDRDVTKKNVSDLGKVVTEI